MFIFLPDSPVTAPLLSKKHRRMAVERLSENQTGVENKHLKWYQVKEAFMDYKLYFFFMLGVVGNIPNGGISNFGTIIIKGFGFSTLVTTLMQVSACIRAPPLSLIDGHFVGPLRHFYINQHPNLRLPQRPLHKQTLHLHPDLPHPQHQRRIRSPLRQPGPTRRPANLLLPHRPLQRRLRHDPLTTDRKHSRPHEESRHKRRPLPRLLHRQHRRPILLQDRSESAVSTGDLEHDC